MTINHQRFEFGQPLGAGGFGVVYKARDLALNRDVAVKVFGQGDGNIASIVKEAKSLSKIDHPNVVKVFGLEKTDKGELLVVLELLDGENSATILQREGRLACAEVVEIAKQVCSALAHCHERGILHRDIKPENLVLKRDSTGQWKAKLVDFGLAKASNQTSNQIETASGAMKGSFHQMSPEVCNGGRATVRSDIYSLGCTLFELVTGRTVFESYSPVQLIVQHATQLPPDLAKLIPDSDRNEQLERCINTCLQKDPESRFSSATQMLVALSSQDYSQCLPKQKLPPGSNARKLVTVAALLFMIFGITCAFIAHDNSKQTATFESAVISKNKYRDAAEKFEWMDRSVASHLKAKQWLAAALVLFRILSERGPLKASEISQCKTMFEHYNGLPDLIEADLLTNLALHCAIGREQNLTERRYWVSQSLRFANKSMTATRLHAGTYSYDLYRQLPGERAPLLRAIALTDEALVEATEKDIKVPDPVRFKVYCDTLACLPEKFYKVDKELHHAENYLDACLSNKKSPADQAFFHSLRGAVRDGLKNYPGSIDDLLFALKQKNDSDPLSRAGLMISVSNACSKSDDPDRALEYAKSAYSLCKDSDRTDSVIVATSRLAEAYVDLQKYAEAEVFFAKATSLARKGLQEVRSQKDLIREEGAFAACNSACLRYLSFLLRVNKLMAVKRETEIQEALWKQSPEFLRASHDVNRIRELARSAK